MFFKQSSKKRPNEAEKLWPVTTRTISPAGILLLAMPGTSVNAAACCTVHVSPGEQGGAISEAAQRMACYR